LLKTVPSAQGISDRTLQQAAARGQQLAGSSMLAAACWQQLAGNSPVYNEVYSKT